MGARPTAAQVALPACEGGQPVRAEMLPYGHQCISDRDVERVAEVLRSPYLTTGPEVERFERALAARTGAQEAIAVSNGTAALQAAAAMLDLRPEDEVIVPALTFAATANCVRYAGARVVFADVQAETLTIDPKAVEAAITLRTRAIIAVDFAGLPADYPALRALADRHRLTLIADAAHSLGATHQGKPVMHWADMATLSFHPVKHITCGEGGAVVTSRGDWAQRLRRFRNHGIDSDARQREEQGGWFYQMEELGYNLRLSDIQCALAHSQLQNLDASLQRRRELAAYYHEHLREIPALELPAAAAEGGSAWHLYVVRLRRGRLRVDRAQIFRALRAENIGVNVHYIPVPWHPYYQTLGYQRGQWPVAEGAYERAVTLPLWAGMSDGDAADVVAALAKVALFYAA